MQNLNTIKDVQESIFSKIIKGEIPCYKIYEDDTVLAFLDIHPVQPGHVLVVTKQQVDHIWDLDEASYQHLMMVTKRLALRLRDQMGTNRVASQIIGSDVPHCHIHLVPISTGADLHGKLSEGEPDHQALAALAKKLAL